MIENIRGHLHKNRLSSVKKVQVRFVASDRRVVCDQNRHLTLLFLFVAKYFTSDVPRQRNSNEFFFVANVNITFDKGKRLCTHILYLCSL